MQALAQAQPNIALVKYWGKRDEARILPHQSSFSLTLAPLEVTTTPDGLLLVAAVLVPFVGVLAAFALGGRNAQRVATLTILAGVGIAIAAPGFLISQRISIA